jgi:hypothetical protein
MIFSEKLVNVKIVDNFISLLESIIIQIFEFICGRYNQTTKLDRDKSEQGNMT